MPARLQATLLVSVVDKLAALALNFISV